jgi:pentatricopeptide repeat protein
MKLYLGLILNKMPEKMFDLLDQTNIRFDQVTLTVLFNGCAHVANDRAKQIGRKLLNEMPVDFRNHNVLITSAIKMLMKFGDVQYAEKLFRMNKKKDIVICGAMMNGYNIHNEPFKCLQLLEEIKQHGFILNETVSIILIKACARLSMLSRCQSIIEKIPSHFFSNQHIRNSLIYMWICIHSENSYNNGSHSLILFYHREKLVRLKML